jgi:hypothetical protein
MSVIKERPLIQTLPDELIQGVIKYLSPVDLTSLGATCRFFRKHYLDESPWKACLVDVLPGKDLSTLPSDKKYRHTFLSHQPYWFLTKYKIWFGDTPHHGKVLIARYSAKRQVIEAYVLAAERGKPDLELWHHNPDVIIHSFDPRPKLDLSLCYVKIPASSSRNFPADDRRFQRELLMDTQSGPEGAADLYSSFMLTKACPPAAIGPQTEVWPPQKIPAIERTRNASVEGFRGSGHRPSKLKEVSEGSFRIRKWVEFSHRGRDINMRVAEDVDTFGTLDPACYKPTKQKPWRGIWVGDYAGHGCEFLAVLQPDEDVQLPAAVRDILEERHRRLSQQSNRSSNVPPHPILSHPIYALLAQQQPAQTERIASSEWMGTPSHQSYVLRSFANASSSSQGPSLTRPTIANAYADENDFNEDDRYRGQLVAIKLTGDINVPRGEITFIAPDLSDDGLVRIATEEPFEGCRVVRSCGHIASTGFVHGELQFNNHYDLEEAITLAGPTSGIPELVNRRLTGCLDTYIPSQLILVNDDCLAQYWEAFGHVSFYKRVDIDALLECD